MEAKKKDFKQFEKEIREQLEQIYKGKGTVSIRSVWKNNGVCLRALSVIQSAGKVAPTMYLEDFYEKYCKGKTIEAIVEEMAAFYEHGAGVEEIEVGYFMDYDQVKDTFRIKLINYEKNTEFLTQVPYCRFLDFAVVCYSQMDNKMLWNGMIMVNHSHLQMWNKTEEELFACAIENSQKYAPESLLNMAGFMDEVNLEKNIDWKGLDEYGKGTPPQELVQMYVLTNKLKVHGASVLYYPHVMEKCAAYLNSDFYILPSSIHELILLPDTDTGDCIEELLSMVKDVNNEQVDREETLSYHVYHYDHAKGCIENLVTKETVPAP